MCAILLTTAKVTLHGVNVYLDYMRFDDTALLKKLLPAANVVRLVGVFWRDVERVEDCACCTDNPAEGYFAPACLDAARTYRRTYRPVVTTSLPPRSDYLFHLQPLPRPCNVQPLTAPTLPLTALTTALQRTALTAPYKPLRSLSSYSASYSRRTHPPQQVRTAVRHIAASGLWVILAAKVPYLPTYLPTYYLPPPTH